MLRKHELKSELITRPKYRWETAKTVEECEQVIQENLKAITEWQAAHKPVIVMCPPTYYKIQDTGTVAGNGFLEEGAAKFNEDKATNLAAMNRDWHAFQTLLTDRGVTTVNMNPRDGLDDQVFTADPSQSYVFVTRTDGKLAQSRSITIFSNFAHPGRVEETDETIKLFESIKSDARFADIFNQRVMVRAKEKMEGTGDNLIDPYRGIIASGYGKRNSAESLKELEGHTGIPVYGIKSKEPFFHVDTYTCVLPGGYVLYAPEVMHEEGIEQLENTFFKGHTELKEKYGIIVSKEDADAFVCNAVIIGNDIIMQPCSDSLRDKLREKGFNVTFAPAQIANLAGGGFHCMTNKINQPIFYNPDLTLAQRIRNGIVEGKSEESIVSSLSDHGKPEEVKAVYAEVRSICDDAAKVIQRSFRLWQAKKQTVSSMEDDLKVSQVATAGL